MGAQANKRPALGSYRTNFEIKTKKALSFFAGEYQTQHNPLLQTVKTVLPMLKNDIADDGHVVLHIHHAFHDDTMFQSDYIA